MVCGVSISGLSAMSFGGNFTKIIWGNVTFQVTGTHIWSHCTVLLFTVPSGVIVSACQGKCHGFGYLLVPIAKFIFHLFPISYLWTIEWKLLQAECMVQIQNFKINNQFTLYRLKLVGCDYICTCVLCDNISDYVCVVYILQPKYHTYFCVGCLCAHSILHGVIHACGRGMKQNFNDLYLYGCALLTTINTSMYVLLID